MDRLITSQKYFILGLFDPNCDVQSGHSKVLKAYLIENLTGQGSDLCQPERTRSLIATHK
jgi:hypothetical protein